MNARILRGVIDTAADAIAANRQQARRLYDPATPEVDSLAERILDLRRTHGVSAPVISGLLRDVRDLIALNDTELGHERTITGTLDALDRAERAASRPARVRSELSIRALVRRLRGDLDTLAAAMGGTEYALAATRVREVCEQAPPEKLLSRTLRHELGGRRHDLLVEVVRSVER